MSKFECQGKRAFDSKEDALEEIYLNIQESFGGVMDLRTYKCKYCKKWHLTSRTD